MNELLQDRVPPQNIEAEQAVLGSIFLDADVLIEVDFPNDDDLKRPK